MGMRPAVDCPRDARALHNLPESSRKINPPNGLTSVHAMDNIIHVMEICVCAKCQHEWARNSERPLPKRCPNHDCRTKHWNSKGTVGSNPQGSFVSRGAGEAVPRKELKYEPIE